MVHKYSQPTKFIQGNTIELILWMTEKLNIMDALASIQNQSYWARFKKTIHTQNESQPVCSISHKNTCLFVQFIS